MNRYILFRSCRESSLSAKARRSSTSVPARREGRRYRRGFAAMCILVFVLASSPACQSGLTIKVEKLEGVSGRWDGQWDAVLASVHEALLGLDQLCRECRETYGDKMSAHAQCPLPATQDAIRALLPLADELTLRRARGEVGGAAFAAQVDALRRRTVELLPKMTGESLDGLAEMEIDEDRRLAMMALAERLPAEVENYSARLQATPAGAAGFGGFRQAGVYCINPGDPMYDAVLRAGAAANPLTSAQTRATGDAGVMIVQESPGQLRLYQISNDPVSVMRNATLILDKVLQAAVKFTAAGPP